MLATAGPVPGGPGWAFEVKFDGVLTVTEHQDRVIASTSAPGCRGGDDHVFPFSPHQVSSEAWECLAVQISTHDLSVGMSSVSKRFTSWQRGEADREWER
jgi:hypothetical protein